MAGSDQILRLLAAAYPTLALALARGEPPALSLLDALVAGSPWRLAPASRARQVGYEVAVADGELPTRADSWHDTFNVLAFLAFPRSKQAMHARALQLQIQRAAAGLPPRQRGREEDALALIDEAALLVAGEAPALARFDAARAGAGASPATIDAVVRSEGLRVWVLGHALLEHVLLGRPPIGAGVVTVDCGGDRAAVDEALARRIAAGGFPAPRVGPTLAWPDDIVAGWLEV